jgi:dipeptidyl aminopeptidase/acylaminoacyl peptidase
MWIRSLFVLLGLMAAPASAEPGKVALSVDGGVAVVADDFAATPVVIVPGATWPAWSPDGTRLAFVREGRVWVGAADGSGAAAITNPGGGAGDSAPGGDTELTWTPDGRALLFRRVAPGAAGLFSVPAAGGAARALFHDHQAAMNGTPRFVAGGTRLVFDHAGELRAARADGSTVRRVVLGSGSDELVSLPDGSGYVGQDAGGIVVLRPGDARPLRRIAGTAGRSPLAVAPDGVRLLATASTEDETLGTDLVDLTGATPPRRVGGVDEDRQTLVFGNRGTGRPSWWSPPPAPAPAPDSAPVPDRRPPALVLRSDRTPSTGPVVRGRGRVPIVRGFVDVALLVLDQTGVRSVKVAWVRGRERPRWRDVTEGEEFYDSMPDPHRTYRLLIRATDVRGNTTKQPREVIVKLAP